MTNVIRCDGPGCDQTRQPSDGFSITIADLPWLTVTASDTSHDFHSKACLAKWAAAQGSATAEVTGR